MAARLGPMIEIRVGCRTQDLPVFVRMIDRDSLWGMNNGLKSVITATLAFSIMGYRKYCKYKYKSCLLINCYIQI